MTGALLAGAVTGLGLFLLTFALRRRRVGLARQVASTSTATPPVSRAVRRALDGAGERIRRRLAALAAFCAEQGWEFPTLRADLSIIGKSFENRLATKVLLGVFGFLLGPVLLSPAQPRHAARPQRDPLWLGLVLAGLFFFLPDPGGEAEVGRPAPGLPARHRRLPRPGLDEPVRRARRPGGPHGGQRDRVRVGAVAAP